MHMIHYATADTAFGVVLMAASTRGIRWLALGDDADTLVEALHRALPRAEHDESGGLNAWLAQITAYLSGDLNADLAALPLDLRGTDFQRQVWDALRSIPLGATWSYQQLAESVGQPPTGARAVAAACAQNPVALLVPCHRVLGVGGALSGYRWGLARKAALLALEAGQ